MNYPNLNEMVKYHPYGIPAICDHGNIEADLLNEVLTANAILEENELRGIARLYGCSYDFLASPTLAKLNNKKYKHRQYGFEISRLFLLLKEMTDQGNNEAAKYLSWAERDFSRFLVARDNNTWTYGRYLGIKEELEQYIAFATPKPKHRGLSS